jgi:hypothetical protein
MSAIAFDTLKFAAKLEAGGFSSAQARAAAEAFAEATGQELVTKSDLRAELGAMKAELKTDLAETKADLLKSMFGMLFGAVTVNIIAILGGMFGLAKLLGR